MTARVVAMSHSHALIAEAHVDERLLVVVVPAAAAAVDVVVLALQLVLDPLAVRRVPDEGQDGADALDKERALTRLGVIKSGLRPQVSEKCTTDKGSGKGTCLDTVVAIGIPEELLEARAVEEFADQHLARVVLRDTDALQTNSPIRSYFRGEK